MQRAVDWGSPAALQCINLRGTDECTRGNVLFQVMNADVLTFGGVVVGDDGLCFWGKRTFMREERVWSLAAIHHVPHRDNDQIVSTCHQSLVFPTLPLSIHRSTPPSPPSISYLWPTVVFRFSFHPHTSSYTHTFADVFTNAVPSILSPLFPP